ncbi:DnaJ domain-containing protein [Shimia sp. MMG029]|uniref:DnaJ domain-containing protein n=1 Tax=Shimia sp. MMG029 TaxID=3021978 RepID=UPI0022FF19A9|nr:DnaJ domain-containing protein [Shimia sp. MMG029]MDA5557531.1 DnaJ domain-containing protein [Shimia sp. MMG029]
MSPEIERAYELLEVTPDVSDKEMRSAWRKLVRRYHPDLAKNDPEEASLRMADINAAFDALAYHRSKIEAEEEAKDSSAPSKKPHRSSKTKPKSQTYTKRETPEEPQAEPEAPPKPETKWDAEEQTLVNAASSLFEETRRKLSAAARRPLFSVCH